MAAAIQIDTQVLKRITKLLKAKEIKPVQIVKEFEEANIPLNQPISTKFVPYPDYTDPSFNDKIASKKEFHKNKYDDVNKTTCDDIEFTLTPNQRFLKQFMNARTPYNSILLFHGVGVGKCHAKDTPILLYSGEVRLVQDIQVGDYLMGDDSEPRTVLSLGQGQDEMYEIAPFIGGEPFVVNSEHILCLKPDPSVASASAGQSAQAETIIEMTVKEYLSLPQDAQQALYLYRATGVEFNSVNIDAALAYQYGLNAKNAHLERLFLTSSREARLSVLAGIIDARSSFGTDCYVIQGLQIALSTDVSFLARSLGIGAENYGNKVVLYGSGLHSLAPKLRRVRAVSLRDVKDSGTMTSFTITGKGRGQYYGFTLDGNHRYLLGDFTVTHNTCTSISIAEQFRNVFNKPTLVLLPSKLKENYMKQVFDVQKFKAGQSQCTGNMYVEHIPDAATLTAESLKRKVDKRIRENYELKGFGEFQNIVTNIENAVTKNEPRADRARAKIDAKLKQLFSNRVIIIDEVHNVRAEGEETSKRVPPLLLHVLRLAENVKLVLLTATPMFNNNNEILWLLNFIMANEKRKELKPEQIFKKDGTLTPSGKAKLVEVTRGYVSYMRGENPFTFPIRLYPTKLTDAHVPPKYDIKGLPIPKSLRLKSLPIVPSPMSAMQKAVYDVALKPKQLMEDETVIDDLADPGADADSNKLNKPGRIMQQVIQISNMIYPDPPRAKKSKKSKKSQSQTVGVTPDNLTSWYGKAGFEKCFTEAGSSKEAKGRYFQYKYKEPYKEFNFLDLDHLATCSSKLHTIVESILNSKGIVYVYSYYLYSALVPLAMALEHCGYNKYGGSAGEDRNILRNPAKRGNHKGTYVILASGQEKALSPDFQREIDVIRSAANKNGEIIKVILGTSVSSEGIDFKRIREIHLVEPWYHLNKVEQIVGRAIRHCSHVELPQEERNVTIYHHANVIIKSDDDDDEDDEDDKTVNETIDQRIYRIAENKQTNINLIENILRQNAVDCSLNRAALFFPKKKKRAMTITTSQGDSIKIVPGDDENSKYALGAQCMISASDATAIDNTTFDMTSLEDMVPFYSRHIAAAIDETPVTLDQLFERVDTASNAKLDREIVMVVLNKIIQDRIVLVNAKGSPGTLDYIHDRYIFQPQHAYDTRMSLRTRKQFEPITHTRLRIQGSTRARAETVDTSWASIDTKVKAIFEDMDIPYTTSSPMHKLYGPAIDAVVDRLTEDELMHVATSVAKDPTAYPQQLYQSLVDAYIFINVNDALFIRNIYKQDTYLKFIDNTPAEVTPADESALLNVQPQLPENGINGWTGYIMFNEKKDKIEFKVTNPDAKSDGYVCKQTPAFTVEVGRARIEGLDKEILNNKQLKKERLCIVYELLLRTKPAVFGRTYHTMYLMRQQQAKKAKPAKVKAPTAPKAPKAPKTPKEPKAKAVKDAKKPKQKP